jgi:threonine dehydratase
MERKRMSTLNCKWHGKKTKNGTCAICCGNNSDMHRLCYIDEKLHCYDYEKEE